MAHGPAGSYVGAKRRSPWREAESGTEAAGRIAKEGRRYIDDPGQERIGTRDEEAGCKRKLQEGGIRREVAGTRWDLDAGEACDGQAKIPTYLWYSVRAVKRVG
jgi:hypothetical protein